MESMGTSSGFSCPEPHRALQHSPPRSHSHNSSCGDIPARSPGGSPPWQLRPRYSQSTDLGNSGVASEYP